MFTPIFILASLKILRMTGALYHILDMNQFHGEAERHAQANLRLSPSSYRAGGVGQPSDH